VGAVVGVIAGRTESVSVGELATSGVAVGGGVADAITAGAVCVGEAVG
jgi:hypothetical protein